MVFTTNFRLPLSLLSYVFLLTPSLADPIALTWSGSTYGPDGPWPAVEVDIGFSSTDPIAMYPGAEFASFLLTVDYCKNNKTLNCYGTQAGLYNSAQSELEESGSNGFIQYAPGPNFMHGGNIIGENAKSWIDYWQIGSVSVANVSMALLSSAFIEYPSGQAYPLSVGCMGIGAAETINQTFTMGSGTPNVNASLIPGYLYANGDIKSNSFGMHIGSANPPVKGSFYFGGYDQNRILGDVLTGTGGIHERLSLKDISIDVVDGESPWKNFTSLGGILAAGNSSISSGGIDVKVDGCSPYLSLPKSTCDSLASHLPVTYNRDLGLYTWNTDDVKYSQIVSSASALRFTFLAGSNTKNISISVPFSHLNLTLQEPLVSTDTPYFPCYTGSDNYVLGRAFLQDAFIGANWGKNTWWLAQAPGPNVPSASVVELGNDATTVKTSQNDWKESWSGSWKALTLDDINSGQNVTPVTPGNNLNSTGSSTGSTGLSTGAQAGMGVGIAVGALAIIGLAVFLIMRHRKDAAARAAAAESVAGAGATGSGPGEKPIPPQQYPQAPQGGYYAPINKDHPGSPGQTYHQGYQPYGQYPYHQPPPQELGAMGNTPSELPGSQEHYNPSLLGDHTAPTHGSSPHSGYSNPATGTYGSTYSGSGYGQPPSEMNGHQQR